MFKTILANLNPRNRGKTSRKIGYVITYDTNNFVPSATINAGQSFLSSLPNIRKCVKKKMDRETRQAWEVARPGGPLEWKPQQKHPLQSNEILIKVISCGVCHTDLHYINNDWNKTEYPLVPGHEIVGTVVEKGSHAHKFQIGDQVGVSYIVNACGNCRDCELNQEQYCSKRLFAMGTRSSDGTISRGGWATHVDVNEKFAVKFDLPPECAPLLCAGLTVFTPMKKWLEQKQSVVGNYKLGVVGIGGLGHLAILFGKALGFEVTAFSIHPNQKSAALKLGADDFVVIPKSGGADDFFKEGADYQRSQDLVIDTVAVEKPLYTHLLRPKGRLVLLGIPPTSFSPEFSPSNLTFLGLQIEGSLTGSIQDLEEMLNFAKTFSIKPVVEIVDAQKLPEIISRVRDGSVHFRLVLVNFDSTQN